jgi:hypothetical protein
MPSPVEKRPNPRHIRYNVVGRLLFLLIPTALIFFSGPVFALIWQMDRAHDHGPGGAAPAKSDG